eukprot:2123412-Rhodomonas_salina.2
MATEYWTVGRGWVHLHAAFDLSLKLLLVPGALVSLMETHASFLNVKISLNLTVLPCVWLRPAVRNGWTCRECRKPLYRGDDMITRDGRKVKPPRKQIGRLFLYRVKSCRTPDKHC